jgi:hypothetical protein
LRDDFSQSNMAAPIRLRLDFTKYESFPSDTQRKSWFLLNFENITTIEAVETEIKNRYTLPGSPTLQIDGFSLPPWEKASILRDGDVVV